MAWDPNKEDNYAWLSTQASKHGGVNSYINDIKASAKAEGIHQGHKDVLQWLPLIMSAPVVIWWLVKTGYDRYDKIKKNNTTIRKELKQKSDIAEEVINGMNAIKNHQTDEMDSEEYEQLSTP